MTTATPTAAPDFDALTEAQLRRRTSVKWTTHPADVLPAFVAEMDVPLAAPVTAALQRVVDDGDTGYAQPSVLAEAFAGFAGRRWGWDVDPGRCLPVPDVMTGIGEALRLLTPPGSGVVHCPPVYHQFVSTPREVGRVPVPVPLTADGALDLPGIDAALAAGARAVLLCNPHNPTGRVWSPAELDALLDVVERRGAVLVSDEVHAPLTLAGAASTPVLARGDRSAVAVTSASKAFNLAGLRAGLVVAGSPAVREALGGMSPEMPYRCGLPGVVATRAAWEDGDAWLDALLAHLDRQRTRLGALLAEHLPQVGWTPQQAGYLAWLDTRPLLDRCGGAGPARRFLDVGRVALTDGADFGAEGAGFVRLNTGTTGGLLTEAVRRMAAAL